MSDNKEQAGSRKPIRELIYNILENPEEDSRAKVFNWALIVLICLNIAAVIVTSVDGIYDRYKLLFNYFEYFSIAVFTIEYLLRIWTASCHSPKPKTPYIFSFYGIVDLLAILPFYLPFIFGIDLRILRVFRLFRIIKLIRYNDSFQMISKVLKNEKDKLFATFFIMIILILFSSSMMYFIENNAQPDQFPNIPATLWWSIATLTTVGYGDVYPITILGKLLGGIIAVLGIGLVAMPSGIIAMGLIQEVRSSAADPENMISVFDTLEKYQVKINVAVANACKKLTESGSTFNIVGNQQKDAAGYGRYFSNTGEKHLFFGLNPQVCKEKDGKDYVYSLAINKGAINYKAINKVEYPYLPDDTWIYIQVDRNIYVGDDPVGKLCETIVDIVQNVYLKNPPESGSREK